MRSQNQKKTKKLTLNKETIRNLDSRELDGVAGGMAPTFANACTFAGGGICNVDTMKISCPSHYPCCY
jgi:natural product precursor